MNLLEKFVQNVSSWPGVSIHPHRFGGREFRFANGEIGHVHAGGILDVPFPRAIRDALVEEALAEQHQWVPNSGWVTYRIRSEADLPHALWLMRLSYLRYVLKRAADPHKLLEDEFQQLQLSPPLRSLFNSLIQKSHRQEHIQGVSA